MYNMISFVCCHCVFTVLRRESGVNMSEQLFLEERRRLIMDHLRLHGRVSVKALSEKLNVSAVTIRQDLRALEEAGLLERTYGGAVLPFSGQAGPELSFDLRLRQRQEIKEAIARAAAKMIRDGYGIALDASTTTFALVPHLKQFKKLVVITNSLMIAQRLLDSPQIQVFLPGGRLRRDSIAVVGRPETLPDINLNLGFFGTRGISLERGVTETDPDEAEMKRALTTRCLSTVILADHTKWDTVAPFTFVELEDVETILTDDRAPEGLLNRYRNQGIDVVAVPAAEK